MGHGGWSREGVKLKFPIRSISPQRRRMQTAPLVYRLQNSSFVRHLSHHSCVRIGSVYQLKLVLCVRVRLSFFALLILVIFVFMSFSSIPCSKVPTSSSFGVSKHPPKHRVFGVENPSMLLAMVGSVFGSVCKGFRVSPRSMPRRI